MPRRSRRGGRRPRGRSVARRPGRPRASDPARPSRASVRSRARGRAWAVLPRHVEGLEEREPGPEHEASCLEEEDTSRRRVNRKKRTARAGATEWPSARRRGPAPRDDREERRRRGATRPRPERPAPRARPGPASPWRRRARCRRSVTVSPPPWRRELGDRRQPALDALDPVLAERAVPLRRRPPREVRLRCPARDHDPDSLSRTTISNTASRPRIPGAVARRATDASKTGAAALRERAEDRRPGVGPGRAFLQPGTGAARAAGRSRPEIEAPTRKGCDAQVDEARDGAARRVRVNGREDEVARHGGLDREVGGLAVADLSDHERCPGRGGGASEGRSRRRLCRPGRPGPG